MQRPRAGEVNPQSPGRKETDHENNAEERQAAGISTVYCLLCTVYFQGAFTLVEMLVVVVILGILISLLGVAVQRGLATAKRAGNRVEIGQFDTGMQAFLQFLQGGLHSEQNRFCEKRWQITPRPNVNNPLYQDSYQYLLRLWPASRHCSQRATD